MEKVEGHSFNSNLFRADSLIIDIGGNNGGFSQTLLNTYNCQVICYEPCKVAYNFLKTIKSDKFTAINKAVSGKNELRTFYSAQPMNGGNSIISGNREFGRYPNQESTYDVEAISFNSIIENFDYIDLIKMDCEGSEFEIIKESDPNSFKKIKQMCIEFHDFCFKQFSIKNIEECIEILRNTGFKAIYSHQDPDRDYYFYR